jgi:hypothetical protein
MLNRGFAPRALSLVIMELSRIVGGCRRLSFEVQHSAPFSMDASGVKPQLRVR